MILNIFYVNIYKIHIFFNKNTIFEAKIGKNIKFLKNPPKHCLDGKLVYKPSSVLDGHLSRRGISDALKRCKQQVEQTICRYLASSGVYIAPIVTNRSVSSYLAISTLPQKWRYISVALSLKSPSPAINRHSVL